MAVRYKLVEKSNFANRW